MPATPKPAPAVLSPLLRDEEEEGGLGGV